MAKQKKPVHRVQMTEGKRNIIHQLLVSAKYSCGFPNFQASVYYGKNVPLFRRNGYRKPGAMIP